MPCDLLSDCKVVGLIDTKGRWQKGNLKPNPKDHEGKGGVAVKEREDHRWVKGDRVEWSKPVVAVSLGKDSNALAHRSVDPVFPYRQISRG
jgi:hypothetical protein